MLPRVTIDTLEAVTLDMFDNRSLLAECLKNMESENPIIHSWITRRTESEAMHLVTLYKLLRAQAENDQIQQQLEES